MDWPDLPSNKHLIMNNLGKTTHFGTSARKLAAFGVFANLITNPADGSNEGRVITKIHFSPEVVDIDIHDVGHGVHIKPPDLLENRGAGDRLPRQKNARMRAESSAKTKGFAT